jgi:pyruvate dehydrogenase E2 component (dihydrolipoamide acetyltransferase)
MPELLRMPEVAANTTEAVLLSWPVSENTPYSAQQTIATVETAKAVVDVPAPSDGIIFKTLVGEGTEVAIGAAIALIGTPEEKVDDIDAALAALGVSDAPDSKSAVALEIPEADPTPSAPVASIPTPAVPLPRANGNRVFASPLARRLAREASLRVEDISGSGPNNRIIRRDVEAALAARAAGSPTNTDVGRADDPSRGTIDQQPSFGFVDRPHSRLRIMIAARLTESKQTAPHFYLRGSARVDKLLKMRGELNEAGTVRVSVNDLVIKAVAHAHVQVPAMNVVWRAESLRSFSSVDIAVAIATDDGLVTPVIRGVEAMNVTSVAGAVKDYAERARAGRLKQHELEGGSITVTNLGMFGTEDFAAIINPPQAAILAVGSIRQEPIVAKGKVRVGSVMRVTLSVDHRPVDGVIAAEWMRVFLSALQHPLRILL